MIIDTKIAIEKSNNNVELAKELFSMLINDLPQSLNNIKSAYQSESSQDLQDQAHRLLGSTAYCGVPNLKAAAENLENCIKSNDKNNIQTNITEVESAINELIQNTTEILESTW